MENGINPPSFSTVKRDVIDRTNWVGIVSLYLYGGQRRPSRVLGMWLLVLRGQILTFREDRFSGGIRP
jgi:hypothetical protein